MLDACRERGPDGSTILTDGDLTVGFCRLAIVGDRRAVTQPLETEASIGAVNGEFYNHRPGRSGRDDGVAYDSDALLSVYEADRDRFPEGMDGIFAGFVFDRRKRRLTLFRDHVGVKPLFSGRFDGAVAFASTVAALSVVLQRPEIDPAAVRRYLLDGYPATRQPLLRGVQATPPGHVVRFHRPSAPGRIHRWFTPGRPSAREAAPTPAAIRELLIRLVSEEIPGGWPAVSTLSGGIDSTLITLLLRREGLDPYALTVAYRDADQESLADLAVARRVARDHGLRHVEVEVGVEDYAAALVGKWRFDQPIGDPNALAFHRLALATRDLGSRVLFSGDGADELFAGYTYHADAARSVVGAVGQSWFGTSMSSQQDRSFVRLLTGSWVGRGVHPSAEDPVTAVRRRDLTEWLEPNLLAKLDRFGMTAEVEARVPFLRPELVRAAFQVPGRSLLRGGQTKAVLREAFADMLPGYVLARRKVGFPAPLSAWLRGDFGRQLAADAEPVAGLWRASRERELWRQHLQGHRDWGQQLWRLVILRAWSRSL
jgi:asparagine synthase (glutamine-hydrolysing)